MAVAIGLSAIVLIACTLAVGSGDGNESTTSTAPQTTLPQFLPLYPSPSVTMEALVEGTLTIDLDGPCTAVLQMDGWSTCVAFPEGTALDVSDPTKPILLMEGCRPLADGEHVEFGGGFLSWGEIQESVQFRNLAGLPRDGVLSDGISLVGGCDGASRGAARHRVLTG